MTTKLLTQAQAEGVYAAMCALNNVSGFAKRIRFGFDLVVGENDFHAIVIEDERTEARETYPSQHDFAVAYGLTTG